MKSSQWMLWLASILAFVAWGLFAWVGKTPVDPFIIALSAAVTGSGVHAVKGQQSLQAIIDALSNLVPASQPQPAKQTAESSPPKTAASPAAVPVVGTQVAATAPSAAPLQ